eukprot:CAMPEP_0183761384 /NCGR_PEP_ID=MMETSP0739-20130205/8407_1 /TAXON_ID=385413 /ORGANISM="Thalassiosira miniscula, Strain CCMP1093" /LENGTH=234 /DNA_ID=CAMNT_0025999533 /DNA_START=210 /DNA_END=910 /DNA_ORIENTATION=+
MASANLFASILLFVFILSNAVTGDDSFLTSEDPFRRNNTICESQGSDGKWCGSEDNVSCRKFVCKDNVCTSLFLGYEPCDELQCFNGGTCRKCVLDFGTREWCICPRLYGGRECNYAFAYDDDTSTQWIDFRWNMIFTILSVLGICILACGCRALYLQRRKQNAIDELVMNKNANTSPDAIMEAGNAGRLWVKWDPNMSYVPRNTKIEPEEEKEEIVPISDDTTFEVSTHAPGS